MGAYVASIWRCRYFWMSLVKMDLRTRYRGSVLGLGWSLLQPVAMTAILCVAFHRIFEADVVSFAPFLLAGLACWSFIVGSVLGGCGCFHQAEAYIRQYPAPLVIYPLRTVLGLGFHFLLALGIVIGFRWATHGFGNVPALLTLAPGMVLLMVFAWSLAVLGGLANVHFPDTRHLAEVAFQGLFYLTPIIYPAELLRQKQLAWVFAYNPLVSFLQLVRAPVLDGEVPSLVTFLSATATTTVALIAACYALRRLERRFIYYL
jgi:lipopolysaccharide transport system permease protein